MNHMVAGGNSSIALLPVVVQLSIISIGRCRQASKGSFLHMIKHGSIKQNNSRTFVLNEDYILIIFYSQA